MKTINHCKNLNHGKMLVSIQYCPMCGEKFNTPTNVEHCNEQMHASRRKNRDCFCCDCGKKLALGKEKITNY